MEEKITREYNKIQDTSNLPEYEDADIIVEINEDDYDDVDWLISENVFNTEIIPKKEKYCSCEVPNTTMIHYFTKSYYLCKKCYKEFI